MLNRLRQLWPLLKRVGSIVPTSWSFTGKVIREYKGVRRGLLLWACWLITHVTLRIYQNPVLITTPMVAAYTVTVGILATVIGFYMAGRNQQDKDAPK